MNSTVFSILLVIIGLVVGIILTFVINKIRVNNAESKIKSLTEKAKYQLLGNSINVKVVNILMNYLFN